MYLRVVDEMKHRVMSPRLEEPRDQVRGKHLRM
jgi:hypothetical protein